MVIKTISTRGFAAFTAHLLRAETVYGVKKHESAFAFGELSDASELVLDYDVTIASPKVFFQPPRETLFDFSLGKTIATKAHIDANPFVIVGIHPYDLKAINQMDRIWSETHVDPHYRARRQAATIIAVLPTRASKWSFWAWMDATEATSGFDLLLTDIGESYTIDVGTDKGAALLRTHASDVRDALPADLALREKARQKLASMCRPDRAVQARTEAIPPLMRGSLDHPIWEEQAKKCYSCGSCNLVCPTCYCFDVKDHLELDLVHGKRTRNWDACLLEEFAHVGSGENFREHRADRFRHRLLRKTVYVPDKIGELACVGCGRCADACLPKITDPVAIINAIKEGT